MKSILTMVSLVVLCTAACQRQGVHPDPKAAIAACQEGIQSILEAGSSYRVLAAACAEMYVEKGCREAFVGLEEAAPNEWASRIADACRKAYCPLLEKPRPELCDHKELPGSPTMLMVFWQELNWSILARDLGPDLAAKHYGRLAAFQMATQPEMFEPGEGKQPKVVEFCGQKFSTNTSEVICRNRKEVENLNPLKNLKNLYSLDLTGTGVSDLRPLSKLTHIEVLHIEGTQVRDISPLENFEHLEVLSVSATEVDLIPLKKLRFIEELHISGANLDLSSLEGTPIDHVLSISCDQVDLTPLKDINPEKLILSITQAIDYTPLKDFKNVEVLSLTHSQISDLTPLKDLKNLEGLELRGTKVSDLSPLKDLKNLDYLVLSHTQVNDLTPLKDLKNLRRLDLRFTQVNESKIEAIKKALPELEIKR